MTYSNPHALIPKSEKAMVVTTRSRRVLGFTLITTANDTPAGLGTIPAGATMAIIQAQAQAARYRSDPDAVAGLPTSGFNLPVDTPREIFSDLSAFRFVRATAGTLLAVEFYGE